MNRRIRIAIVEDDVDLRETTEALLDAAGYAVWSVASAEAFYRRLAAEPVDIVVLDIGLPGEDGLSVAKVLQDNPAIAVIIVSARDAIDDRLAGLHAGADRYLVKPVNPVELRANIEAVTRRMPGGAPFSEPAHLTQAGLAPRCPPLWLLDGAGWVLTSPAGRCLALTAREYALLAFLVEARGEPVRKQVLAEQLFGARVANGGERLNVMVARLRRKAAEALQVELPVRTAHHVGYAFTAAARIVAADGSG